jgi:hypothetical protein
MNPPSAPPVNRLRTEYRWLWGLVAVVLLLPVLLAVGVASYFLPSSDTKALRNGLIRSSGVEWQRRIALNVGGFTLGAVRTGLSFANLDAEARAALQAVRGVEFGICQLPSDARPPDRAAMLAAADTAMTARGWDRIVGVMDGPNLVTVYMPARTASARRLKCCVMVFDGQQMIVASARANLEPLLQCLLEQPEVRTRLQSLAKR